MFFSMKKIFLLLKQQKKEKKEKKGKKREKREKTLQIFAEAFPKSLPQKKKFC